MTGLKWKGLVGALRQVGLDRGDVVLVQSRLFSFGPLEGANDRDSIPHFHLSAIQEVLGQEGTLSVLTFNGDYARYGTPFVVEETPSQVGVFSEYVRTRPGTVRSIHPLVSVTSLGARAEEISGGPHFDGYGYDSPWGRLHRMNAKLMVYGAGLKDGMSYYHYIERLYGVAYQYTKVYDIPVYQAGKQVPGPFTMSVRYLDFGIAYNDTSLFEKRLLDSGRGRQLSIGRTRVSMTTCDEALEVGIEAIRENRYFFLQGEPNFRPGEIPADGLVGPMQESYDRVAPTETGSR